MVTIKVDKILSGPAITVNYLLIGNSQSDLTVCDTTSDDNVSDSIGFNRFFGGSGEESSSGSDSGCFVALVFVVVGPHELFVYGECGFVRLSLHKILLL